MRSIDTLGEIADEFDAIVLDQWGVLHDGSAPYPQAIATLAALTGAGVRFAVLSNSGKRSAPNAARIADMGFDASLFETVMTSGEALWQDIAKGRVGHRSFYPITRAPGDATDWAEGLNIALVDTLDKADAILLMGLPDSADTTDFDALLAQAHRRQLPLICTNPDRGSPRADGVVVVSPGALAHAYKDMGGEVRFYGKPYAPVFQAVAETLGTTRLLMVGDSLEHDIAGGAAAGWATAFIRGGLHAAAFDQGADIATKTAEVAAKDGAPLPTFTLAHLE